MPSPTYSTPCKFLVFWLQLVSVCCSLRRQRADETRLRLSLADWSWSEVEGHSFTAYEVAQLASPFG